MAKASLGRAAYILVLIGGILMVILGFLGLVGMAFMSFFFPVRGFLGGLGAIVDIILGIVAIYGARRATDLVWAIVLIVIGLIGGGLGGTLVLIGGLLGLISRFI